MRTRLATAALAVAATLSATPSPASVVLSFKEDASGVLLTISGSIDTTNRPSYAIGPFALYRIQPVDGTIASYGPNSYFYYLPPNSIQPFGTKALNAATSGSGTFGLIWGLTEDYLVLPGAYQPADPISASLFFSGQTYVSLGITPTDFSYYLPTEDKISFTFATANTPVPEPATWALAILGFGMAGATLRRQRKVRVRFA